jgi:hypothetical protein
MVQSRSRVPSRLIFGLRKWVVRLASTVVGRSGVCTGVFCVATHDFGSFRVDGDLVGLRRSARTQLDLDRDSRLGMMAGRGAEAREDIPPSRSPSGSSPQDPYFQYPRARDFRSGFDQLYPTFAPPAQLQPDTYKLVRSVRVGLDRGSGTGLRAEIEGDE